MSEHKFRWCDPEYSVWYQWTYSEYYYTKNEQISFAEEAISAFPELLEYFKYATYPVPKQDVTERGNEIYKKKRPEILKKAKSGEEFIKLITELLISLPKNGIVF